MWQLIDESAKYLKPEGEVWIEFDPWQVPLIDTYLEKQSTWSHSYLQDQYEKDRVLILKKK